MSDGKRAFQRFEFPKPVGERTASRASTFTVVCPMLVHRAGGTDDSEIRLFVGDGNVALQAGCFGPAMRITVARSRSPGKDTR